MGLASRRIISRNGYVSQALMAQSNKMLRPTSLTSFKISEFKRYIFVYLGFKHLGTALLRTATSETLVMISCDVLRKKEFAPW